VVRYGRDPDAIIEVKIHEGKWEPVQRAISNPRVILDGISQRVLPNPL
jgi:hypothetical protein